MKAEALRLTCLGFAVLPVHSVTDGRCSCSKRAQCPSPGKHPIITKWVEEATTDAPQVAEWWRTWPKANIGIATGSASGIVVLDIDPRSGGDDSLDALIDEHGPLPDTVEVITGDGRHVYFAHPGGTVLNSVGKLGPGLDTRSDGGYVVAPPSLHASGRRYWWEASSTPDAAALTAMPPWMVHQLGSAAREARPLNGDEARRVDPAAILRGVPEGRRDVDLFRYASSLRARGLGRAEAEALVSHAAGNCAPPFPASEALQKVESAWRYEPGDRSVAVEVEDAHSRLGAELDAMQLDLDRARDPTIFSYLVTIAEFDDTGLRGANGSTASESRLRRSWHPRS